MAVRKIRKSRTFVKLYSSIKHPAAGKSEMPENKMFFRGLPIRGNQVKKKVFILCLLRNYPTPLKNKGVSFMVTTLSNKTREAVNFILGELKDKPNAELAGLIDEAGMRFNLTPLDTEALTRILRDETKNS